MRGKHASSAEARRVRENAISSAETAQRRVKDLTAENTELHQDINGLLQSHNTEMHRIRIALVKCETPALVARDQIIAGLRADLTEVRANRDSISNNYEKFLVRLFDHFRSEHQMTGADVMQEVLLKDEGKYLYDGPNAKALRKPSGFDAEAAGRLDVVKGVRSRASVVRDAQQYAATDEVPS
jgi:hypothetical protein